MLKISDGIKTASKCLLFVTCAVLCGCIWYTPKMLPRLNQTEIGNYPLNCNDNGILFRNWKIHLTRNRLATHRQLLWLTNTSRQSVIIDMVIKNRSASAGWASTLEPQNWSALLQQKPAFTLQCFTADGHYRHIDCGNMISACWMPVKASKKALNGNYWVSEDRSMQGTYENIDHRGFTLLSPGE
ncbi:MAG: hypothetical protein P1U63_06030 [Coxiellaceae bacterium]|nr:hypothetical protein [Coxiellaceae bacterium]